MNGSQAKVFMTEGRRRCAVPSTRRDFQPQSSRPETCASTTTPMPFFFFTQQLTPLPCFGAHSNTPVQGEDIVKLDSLPTTHTRNQETVSLDHTPSLRATNDNHRHRRYPPQSIRLPFTLIHPASPLINPNQTVRHGG